MLRVAMATGLGLERVGGMRVDEFLELEGDVWAEEARRDYRLFMILRGKPQGVMESLRAEMGVDGMGARIVEFAPLGAVLKKALENRAIAERALKRMRQAGLN